MEPGDVNPNGQVFVRRTGRYAVVLEGVGHSADSQYLPRALLERV